MASACMLGLSVFSFLLSIAGCRNGGGLTSDAIGRIMAGLEFFASAMWVACSLLLANHYKSKPLLFSRGVTFLSLSSTMGQLAAKLLGSTLVSCGVGWRSIARLGAATALAGAIVVRTLLPSESGKSNTRSPRDALSVWGGGVAGIGRGNSSPSLLDTFHSVVFSKLFWMVGLGHIAGYLPRTCDRVLGPFLKDLTSLPRTFLEMDPVPPVPFSVHLTPIPLWHRSCMWWAHRCCHARLCSRLHQVTKIF